MEQVPPSFRPRQQPHSLVLRIQGEEGAMPVVAWGFAVIALLLTIYALEMAVCALLAGAFAVMLTVQWLIVNELEIATSEVRLVRRVAGIPILRRRKALADVSEVTLEDGGGALAVVVLKSPGEDLRLLADGHPREDAVWLQETLAALVTAAAPAPVLPPLPAALRAMQEREHG